MLEADLAFQGVDLRDVWVPESGMTLRRLHRLVVGLPPTAAVWAAAEAAQKAALVPTADRIRERQAHYAAQGNA